MTYGPRKQNKRISTEIDNRDSDAIALSIKNISWFEGSQAHLFKLQKSGNFFIFFFKSTGQPLSTLYLFSRYSVLVKLLFFFNKIFYKHNILTRTL